MSLINKMLRDLNARHALDAEPALPDQARPLAEGKASSLIASIGRGGWFAFGTAIIAIVITGLVVYAPWPAMSAKPSSPIVSAPEPIPTDLIPPLLSLAKALPLGPPGSAGTSGSKAKINDGRKAQLSSPQFQLGGLKLDSGFTKTPQHAGESSSIEKHAPTPLPKAAPDAVSPLIQKEARPSGEKGDESYRKASNAFRQGRMAEAVTQLQNTLRENPRHAAARQALLSILVDQKRWDEALVLLKEGLELMPEQVSWAMAMARIQVERGNTTEALDILQKHQAQAESNADYQGFAGVLLQSLKKPHEAVLRYRAALRLKPNEGRWWYALGNALEADNQAAEATDAFKRAQAAGGLTPAMAEAIEKKLH